ncbi:hypothetical protein ACLOJK_026188 [Asimina triloba]
MPSLWHSPAEGDEDREIEGRGDQAGSSKPRRLGRGVLRQKDTGRGAASGRNRAGRSGDRSFEGTREEGADGKRRAQALPAEGDEQCGRRRATKTVRGR